ncbi:MAG: nitroreductase family protein [Veillonellaceae bacterium]|nr:nitroreductase family protein [Veillonellaceae bacterium]
METLKAMATRKSVREFTDEGITFEDIKKILTAGMSGPSCMNKRMWSFVVIRNKELLGKLSVANGLYAGPLRGAALGILVCGDLERALPEAPEYWVIDASIATQNMVLAAQDLGIGSVWLGCWPCEDRVQEVKELMTLPENIVPHSILALGYAKEPDNEERDLYESDRVHFDEW